MGVDVKSKFEWFRLILAMVISPSVPMTALATTMWQASGSKAWFPLVFLFGYLFFCLFGLPVIGILIKKRTVMSCIVGGGVVTIVPILLLSVFSFSSSNSVLGDRMLFDLMILFMTGSLGGLLFWVVAFAGTKGDYDECIDD
jgi:hypothetical protein